jgi:cysteine-rich repeat protein
MPRSLRSALLARLSVLLIATSPWSAAAIGVADEQKISALAGGFDEALTQNDFFGTGVAGIGDLDGDGNRDVAVGMSQGNHGPGKVWILFLNADGTVKEKQSIGSDGEGGFSEVLERLDRFGGALASLGDVDGDGVEDLAVGASGDDDGDGGSTGAVYILFLNRDGTVKAHQKISNTEGGFTGVFSSGGFSGSAVDSLGDLDGDGIVDIAVGNPLDDEGGFQHGAVWILFLNADGTVKAHQKINEEQGGFGGVLIDHDNFGSSLAALRPFTNEIPIALVVGAPRGSSIDDERGGIWVLGLASDGTVEREQKIAPGIGGFIGDLSMKAHFGSAASSLGDLDGDGVTDVAVSIPDSGGFQAPPGSVLMIFLNADGTLGSQLEISDGGRGGFMGELSLAGAFGASLDVLGDLDGDGVVELAVGATGDDDLASNAGSLWILFLEDAPPACGDGALGPGEECDDGNGVNGDLCSARCETETFLALVGESLGGRVTVEIDGVAIAVESFAGESAADVVAALAAAVSADPSLAGQGVTALARNGFLSTNGAIEVVVIDDAGLATRPHAVEVFGDPDGGSVEIRIEGVSVEVPTQILEAPSDVATNLAIAINLDPVLFGLGVLAFADANAIVTNGEVEIGEVSDPGLQLASEFPGLRCIASDGDATPVGGFHEFDDVDSYVRPSRALMDDAGNVYFRTRIASGDLPDAFFRGTQDDVEAFVLPGQQAPGTEGGVFSDFHYAPSGVQGLGSLSALSGDGELAFFANVAGGVNRSGVFASDGVTTRAVLLEGTPVQGTPGDRWWIVVPLAISDEGEVVLFGSTILGSIGLFLASGPDVTPIAVFGDSAPGTGGGVFDFFFFPPSVAFAGSGELMISIMIRDGTTTELLYSWSEGTFEPLAMAGEPVPGVENAIFECTPHPDAPGCIEPVFGEIAVNASGSVAFRGNFRLLDVGYWDGGIFLMKDGVIEALALRGDPAPGTPLPFQDFLLGPLAINDKGDVAFQAYVRDRDLPAPPAYGLFVHTALGQLEARVLAGTPAPGTGGFLFESWAIPVQIDASGRQLSAVSRFGYDPASFALFRFTAAAPLEADAGPDQHLECTSPRGADVTLDASASFDPIGDGLDYEWTGPFPTTGAVNPLVEVPVGAHPVTLRVEDSSGATDSDEMLVQVVDTARPRVYGALRRRLVPADADSRRGLVPAFEVRFRCRDLCDASSTATATLDGVSVEDGEIVRLARSRPHGHRLRIHCEDASGNHSGRSVYAVTWGRRDPVRRAPPGF